MKVEQLLIHTDNFEQLLFIILLFFLWTKHWTENRTPKERIPENILARFCRRLKLVSFPTAGHFRGVRTAKKSAVEFLNTYFLENSKPWATSTMLQWYSFLGQTQTQQQPQGQSPNQSQSQSQSQRQPKDMGQGCAGLAQNLIQGEAVRV